MSDGYVYFMRTKALSSGVKIGYSANPIKRKAHLESEVGIPLVLIGQFPGTKADERALHHRFKDIRLHGEWFRTPRRMNIFIAKTFGERG